MADSRPLLDSYPLYIDGRWVDPESGRYDDISPASGATIAQAPDAGLGLCDQDSGHRRDRSATAAARPDVLCAALATKLAHPDFLVVPAPPPAMTPAPGSPRPAQ